MIYSCKNAGYDRVDAGEWSERNNPDDSVNLLTVYKRQRACVRIKKYIRMYRISLSVYKINLQHITYCILSYNFSILPPLSPKQELAFSVLAQSIAGMICVAHPHFKGFLYRSLHSYSKILCLSFIALHNLLCQSMNTYDTYINIPCFP